jgi:hemolysin activation/secretion protein
LQVNELEDKLRLLKNDPVLKNLDASLQPSTGAGKSILVVRVEEANPLIINLYADNNSSPAVGAERFGITVGVRNLSGLGDRAIAAYSRTYEGGANVYDFSYRVPINADNGTLQFRVAPSNNRITDPKFEAFGIRGSQNLYEVSYRQPIIRSSRQELALSVGFTYSRGQTFLFEDVPTPFGLGPDQNGVSTTSVLKFGQSYIRRNSQGGWALNSQLNWGTGLFNATVNADPVPDGRFLSWLGQVQRIQSFGKDWQLLLGSDLQLSANSLLPAQQFVVGGGQSVRGYRQNAQSGDNGIRLSAEARLPIIRRRDTVPALQLAPFADVVKVWNHPNNPNSLPNPNLLASTGLGVIVQPTSSLTFRLDYGLPLTSSNRQGAFRESSLNFSIIFQPQF